MVSLAKLMKKVMMTKIESMIDTSMDHLRHRKALAMNLVDGNGVKRVVRAMNDGS
ncbi:hypothetical protein GCM10020331_084800 [Ectobacillus funiculus]